MSLYDDLKARSFYILHFDSRRVVLGLRDGVIVIHKDGVYFCDYRCVPLVSICASCLVELEKILNELINYKRERGIIPPNFNFVWRST